MGADGSNQRLLAAGGEPQWEPGNWIVFDCVLQDAGSRVRCASSARTARSSLACRSVAGGLPKRAAVMRATCGQRDSGS
jgi:hypothetical protein